MIRDISEDIRKKEFRPVYLLYGPEVYLKHQYRDHLLRALLPEGDTMNFTRFEGNRTEEKEIISMGDTMPFFAERRVVLVENSGFFHRKSPDIADYLGRIPEYLVIIFVEDQIDRKTAAFKAADRNGRAVEFAEQREELLERWILQVIGREKKKIRRADLQYLLTLTGTDMSNIRCELEKLLCYTMGRDVIERADIDAVCTAQITTRIFDMVRFVAEKRQKEAFDLYYDLLAEKEPPMRILYLLSREFNQILLIREMSASGMDSRAIGAAIKIPSFVVGKYRPLCRKYSSEELRGIVEDMTETEELVKTGRLDDVVSVELMLAKYARA